MHSSLVLDSVNSWKHAATLLTTCITRIFSGSVDCSDAPNRANFWLDQHRRRKQLLVLENLHWTQRVSVFNEDGIMKIKKLAGTLTSTQTQLRQQILHTPFLANSGTKTVGSVNSQRRDDAIHTAVKRGAHAQFAPKLSLNKVFNKFPKVFAFKPKVKTVAEKLSFVLRIWSETLLMDDLRDSQLAIFSPCTIFITFPYKSLAGFLFELSQSLRRRKPEVALDFCVWPLCSRHQSTCLLNWTGGGGRGFFPRKHLLRMARVERVTLLPGITFLHILNGL